MGFSGSILCVWDARRTSALKTLQPWANTDPLDLSGGWTRHDGPSEFEDWGAVPAYPVEEAARRAVLWAGQWESSATVSVIEQILVTREDFAEDTFWNLAKALGVRARS